MRLQGDKFTISTSAVCREGRRGKPMPEKDGVGFVSALGFN